MKFYKIIMQVFLKYIEKILKQKLKNIRYFRKFQIIFKKTF